jgi:rod shape-determining protein MreD
MRRIPLFVLFFWTLAATVFLTVFFPKVRLHTFLPFLPFLYARCSRPSSLWIASLCGLIVDLLGSEMRFGVHALCSAVTTLCFHHQKKHFYEEKPLALSLLTFGLSVCITLQLFFFCFSMQAFPIGWKSVFADVFLMAALDCLYAFLWFTCPMLVYTRLKTHKLKEEA